MITALTILIWGIIFKYIDLEILLEILNEMIRSGFMGNLWAIFILFLFISTFVSAFQMDRAIVKCLKKLGTN